MERFDIKDDSIATHPRKQMLSMTRPISDDHREIIADYLNEAFVRFKDVVKSGRPALREDNAQLTDLATGQVFTANQAKENGLVDRIGFIEAAIDRAVELADLRKDEVRVVEFQRPVSLLDVSGLMRARESPSQPFCEMLEWSVPQPFYLFTSLPPLATSWTTPR